MKIAVFTGASSGMGREFVIQLENNYSVDEIWVIARRKDRLEELSSLTKTKIKVLPLDLLLDQSFDEYKQILNEIKPDIKLLVNAAGLGRFGEYTEYSLEDDETMMKINNLALVRMTRLSLPYMSKESYIINIASMASYQPTPYLNTYAATKAFVLSYSQALNMEFKQSGRGIRVLAVTPYWVKTEFFNYAFVTNENKVQNFSHLLQPEDVVKLAYHDLFKTNKDISILSAHSKNQRFLVKHLPSGLIMKAWIKQQKKEKQIK